MKYAKLKGKKVLTTNHHVIPNLSNVYTAYSIMASRCVVQMLRSDQTFYLFFFARNKGMNLL